MAAERAAEDAGSRKTVFLRRKPCAAGLALELACLPVVPVEVFCRGTAAWAHRIGRNVAGGTTADRADGPAGILQMFPEELVPVLLLEVFDSWRGIGLELLVLRGMGVIIGPLPERDVPGNEGNKPADLAVLILNNGE